jgi:hypothetical protein
MPEVKADKEWHAFLLDWGAHASGEATPCATIPLQHCLLSLAALPARLRLLLLLLAGLPIQEALAKKFGSQGEQIMQRIFNAGRPDGADFANWKWRANTVKGELLGRCRCLPPVYSCHCLPACQAAADLSVAPHPFRAHAGCASQALWQESRGQ